MVSSLPRLTAAQFGVAPSYLFYAAWDWRFCLLMSFVTVNAFTVGHLVLSFERSGRLLIMARSIGIDLAVLALRNYSFASFPPVVVQASDILCVRGPEYGAFHVEENRCPLVRNSRRHRQRFGVVAIGTGSVFLY